MDKSYWLINANKTEVKRVFKNSKSIWNLRIYVNRCWEIIGLFLEKPTVIRTMVFVDVELKERFIKGYFIRVGVNLKKFGNTKGYIYSIN